MFDNTCKFLADSFPLDLSRWLLGRPINLVQLNPTELSLEPIKADSIILQQTRNLILHTEFQTVPDPDIPFRMLDYRIRVYRKFPERRMRQTVIYLTPSQSRLVYQNTFTIPLTTHQFHIIRLWEQPIDTFLNLPGLLPLAVLSQVSDPEQALYQVANQIDNINNIRDQRNLSAATAILAGLVLPEDTINRILRRDLMRESVFYQSIEEEGRQVGLLEGIERGRQEGRQEGLEEGRQEGLELVALNLLRSGMPNEQVVNLTGLSTEQVLALSQQLFNQN